MRAATDHYDVVVIGSGFCGAALGIILARHGMTVLLLEGGTHPRFAIGESLIIETSEMLRGLAEVYDVPELAYYSSECFAPYIGTSHGVKRHFSFLHHTRGEIQDPNKVLQAVIPGEPYGHELHLFRQDSDAHLVSIAIQYGATVVQRTLVADMVFDETGVDVIAVDGRRFRASYVVDAAGAHSPLASKFDLRVDTMKTHSRALFTHLVGVDSYHQKNASRERLGVPYSLSEGTLHHVFRGGWLWVIPFDNHAEATNPLCSVGLMLDPRVHPRRDDVPADRELSEFLASYPSIARQLEGARPVRDWIRTGRIQYGSSRVVGDRWALLGHAAGFIDPLFSKGLYASTAAVCALARQLLQARETGDFSREAFLPVEALTQRCLHSADQLLSHAMTSFGHYELWRVYSVVWLVGAYLEGLKLVCSRMAYLRSGDRERYLDGTGGLRLVGGGYDGFDAMEAEVHQIMDRADGADPAALEQAAVEVRQVLERAKWIPFAFQDIVAGANHLADRKLRLRLLKREGGMFGYGRFREHFFGQLGWADIVPFVVRERLTYSRRALRRAHERERRARGHL